MFHCREYAYREMSGELCVSVLYLVSFLQYAGLGVGGGGLIIIVVTVIGCKR